jgi:hypothetical protein
MKFAVTTVLDSTQALEGIRHPYLLRSSHRSAAAEASLTRFRQLSETAKSNVKSLAFPMLSGVVEEIVLRKLTPAAKSKSF